MLHSIFTMTGPFPFPLFFIQLTLGNSGAEEGMMSRSLKEDILLALSNWFPLLKEALTHFSRRPLEAKSKDCCVPATMSFSPETINPPGVSDSFPRLFCPHLSRTHFANGWLRSMDSPSIQIAGLSLLHDNGFIIG